MEQAAYRRIVLGSFKYLEIILIIWPPSSRSCAHDHRQSWGWILLLWGSVFQKIFKKSTREYVKTQHYFWRRFFLETPKIIHIMGNSSSRHCALTIHFYWPRKLQMKTYPESELIYPAETT